jgi:predicted ATP-dependent endonuclease of OLD family
VHIKYVEIANFRKLLSIRVDLSEKTTLFVGANNSGKTSAMHALRKFLSPHRRGFETTDITLCHWRPINEIGDAWVTARASGTAADVTSATWAPLLPALDLWLHVEPDELHHVRGLIPTLDWEGGLLGVRLQLQPKDAERLYKEFLETTGAAEATRNAAPRPDPDSTYESKLTVWPSNLIDFMNRRFDQHFAVKAYVLDPERIGDAVDSLATPQVLPADALPIEGDPLAGLIRVDEILAQRGFGETDRTGDDDARARGSLLSNQLRDYYKRHLDPSDTPEPPDVEALMAIQAAENAFNERLTASFEAAFAEVEGMGYPGVTDPRPRVSTRLKATDGLNHAAAVSYEVDVIADDGTPTPLMRLPENSNGLGYQNLISMIFRLMSFRDAWMRIKKAGTNDDSLVEPLHLVLVEEPEAHLHAQVQQVFIKTAYRVLRNHKDLTGDKLRTQLIVSTHSSHVAHEIDFSCLRYFRRVPASLPARVPVSVVVNMSQVFGAGDATERFVKRYLRAQHADLFFADAAILVEGPAERILLPNFIREHHQFLSQCYITILEIGGSHAHRLRSLIEHLGLLTLIVTDIDTLGADQKSAQPERGKNQVTNNATLKSWVPSESDVDTLFDTEPQKKVESYRSLFAVRVAYQYPLPVTRSGQTVEETAYPYTFEDALALENLAFFSTLEGDGLVRKFRAAVDSGTSIANIGEQMFEALKSGKKAEFALDVLMSSDFKGLMVPRYIKEGLEWLEGQLKKKQAEILPAAKDEDSRD